MAGPQIPLSGNIGLPGSAALLGYNNISMTDANYILSAAEWWAAVLVVTSSVALTATRNLVAPLNEGQSFVVSNKTTGGESIQIIGTSGTGVIIPNGDTVSVIYDGTNYLQVGSSGGITELTGDVTAGPGSGSQAATCVAVHATDSFSDTLDIDIDGTYGLGLFLNDPSDGYYVRLYLDDEDLDSPVIYFSAGGSDEYTIYADSGLIFSGTNGIGVLNTATGSVIAIDTEAGIDSIVTTSNQLQIGVGTLHNAISIEAAEVTINTSLAIPLISATSLATDASGKIIVGSGGGGGITALTGDVTASGSGSVVATCVRLSSGDSTAHATAGSGALNIFDDSTGKEVSITGTELSTTATTFELAAASATATLEAAGLVVADASSGKTLTIAGNALTTTDTNLQLAGASGMNGWVQRSLFIDPVGVTISNTTTAMSIFAASGTIGTLTFPANFFIVGRTIRIRSFGIYECDTSTTTITLAIDLAGSATSGVSPTLAVSTSTRPYILDLVISCKSTGSSGVVEINGYLTLVTTASLTDVIVPISATGSASFTFNTTSSPTLNVTIQFSSASANNNFFAISSTIEQIY